MPDEQFTHRCFSSALFAVIASVLCLSGRADADDAAVSIQLVEQWSAVFAGDTAEWSVRLDSERAVEGRCLWTLQTGQRVLARREAAWKAEPGRTVSVKTGWQWPDVREGVVLNGLCLWQVISGTKELTRLEKPVFIFPRKAYSDRLQWLKDLKLQLLDPEGTTHTCFVRENIPHRLLRRGDSLEEVRDGILLVGEGWKLTGPDHLIDDLLTVAKRGIPVLCLATSEGELHWPAQDSSLTAIRLHQADIITQFDKRLDARHWPDGFSFQRGLSLTTHRKELRADVVTTEFRWPWCEWQVSAHPDALTLKTDDRPVPVIWCGFRIIGGWDSGPVPRYLLKAMLERVERRREVE